jgi:hypothetical protein
VVPEPVKYRAPPHRSGLTTRGRFTRAHATRQATDARIPVGETLVTPAMPTNASSTRNGLREVTSTPRSPTVSAGAAPSPRPMVTA